MHQVRFIVLKMYALCNPEIHLDVSKMRMEKGKYFPCQEGFCLNLLAKLKDATTIVISKHQKIMKTIESIEDEMFQQCSC